MSIFIGGCVVLILGIIGIIVWWWHFVAILQGIVPIMLIFAGALAVYLSIDQFKAWLAKRGNKKADEAIVTPVTAKEEVNADLEALRKENAELKKKLETKTEDKVAKKTKAATAKIENAIDEVAETVVDATEKDA